MAWHPDGTLREDTLYSKDTIVSGTSWHANGTIDQRIADGEIIRHLWHPDGSRAMEMRYRVGAGRWGRWTEWDEQGVIVGDARYENNALVETMVADSPLVLGPDPFGGQPRSEVALLPVSSSKRPAGLWPRVAIEGNRLSVDGRYVLELVDGKVAEKDRKGEAFIAPLYDQLREAWDAMQAIRALEANPQSQHDLLFLLPADTPFSMVKQLLYTGGQAQFGPMHFASWHPDLQWPPRSGDAEHQGGFVTTAVSVQLPRIRPPTGLSGASPPPPAGGVEIGADTLTLWWPDKEDLVMPCPAPSCSEETLTRLAQTIEGWRVPGQEEMLLSMLPTTSVGIMVPVMAAMHGASTSPLGVVVTGGKYRPTATPESEKP